MNIVGGILGGVFGLLLGGLILVALDINGGKLALEHELSISLGTLLGLMVNGVIFGGHLIPSIVREAKASRARRKAKKS